MALEQKRGKHGAHAKTSKDDAKPNNPQDSFTEQDFQELAISDEVQEPSAQTAVEPQKPLAKKSKQVRERKAKTSTANLPTEARVRARENSRKRRKAEDVDGPTVYYLGEGMLSRAPIKPAPSKLLLFLLLIVAILIACLLFWTYYQMTYGRAAAIAEETEINLSQEVDYALPDLSTLYYYDDAGITQILDESGYSMYLISAPTEENPDDFLQLMRLPESMDAETAAALDARGLDSLNSAEASSLLNGSWTLIADRTDSLQLVLRYVDFTSGSPEMAVHNAILSQGYDETTIAEDDHGVDNNGNTFATGITYIGEEPFTWRVSSIPFSDMYSTKGLPEDTCYVSIRFY